MNWIGKMTWANKNHSSRIDRIYHKNDFPFKLLYLKTIESGMSDHKMVVARIDMSEYISIPKKKYHWKLNESILNDENICERIRKICDEIPSLIKFNKDKWYDVFIKKIVRYLKYETRMKASLDKVKINFLFEQLCDLDRNKTTECDYIENKNKIMHEIKEYYKNKREGIKKRVCDRRMNFIKQPSKALIEKEVAKNKICELQRYERMNWNCN